MISTLNNKLDNLHLLNHPFYQTWSNGKLSKEILAEYAKEYYQHVEAFPRYISAIHTQCPRLEDRQILLGNLIEEESGEENHPELWARFAQALGCTRSELKDSTNLLPKTKELVDGYYEICNKSYASGLGALYAYERQVPEVAKSKIAGLQKFYNITSDEALKFFKVHITADEWHSDECAGLIAKLSDHDKQVAEAGALKAADLLWGFLDGMVEKHNLCNMPIAN